MSTKVRCQVNERFFENLSPKSRYWFGFMLADGSVVVSKSSYQTGLTLKCTDYKHIQKFRTAIGSTHKIRFYKPKSNFESKFCACGIHDNALSLSNFNLDVCKIKPNSWNGKMSLLTTIGIIWHEGILMVMAP